MFPVLPWRVCSVDCNPPSNFEENDNSSGKFTDFIYDHGDGKSIDIVAQKKSSTRGRKHLADNRRVIAIGKNGRNLTGKKGRKKSKYNSTSCHKRGTASLRSSEGTFRVHKIYGDGNCMFRAVSFILWGNENEHRSLRTLVTQHIRNHWREYGPFVNAEWNITNPEEYENFMISEGVFASELECTVATKLYKMNLSIYRELNEQGDIERVFYNRVSGSYETARLLFSGRSDSGHYDVLFLET